MRESNQEKVRKILPTPITRDLIRLSVCIFKFIFTCKQFYESLNNKLEEILLSWFQGNFILPIISKNLKFSMPPLPTINLLNHTIIQENQLLSKSIIKFRQTLGFFIATNKSMFVVIPNFQLSYCLIRLIQMAGNVIQFFQIGVSIMQIKDVYAVKQSKI